MIIVKTISGERVTYPEGTRFVVNDEGDLMICGGAAIVATHAREGWDHVRVETEKAEA